MGASHSSSSSSGNAENVSKVKACFTQALKREVQVNAAKLRAMHELQLERHIRDLLTEKCLVPMRLGEHDEWASVILKQAACAFAKAIADGCAGTTGNAAAKCAQTAAARCMRQGSDHRDHILSSKKRSPAAASSSRKKKRSHKKKNVIKKRSPAAARRRR